MRSSVLRSNRQKPQSGASNRWASAAVAGVQDDSTDLMQDWQRLTELLVQKEISIEQERSNLLNMSRDQKPPSNNSASSPRRKQNSKSHRAQSTRRGNADSSSAFLGKTGPIFAKDYPSVQMPSEDLLFDPFSQHAGELKKHRRQEAEMEFLKSACYTVRRHLMLNGDALREVKKLQKDKKKAKQTFKEESVSKSSSQNDTGTNSKGSDGSASKSSSRSSSKRGRGSSSMSSNHQNQKSKERSAFMTRRTQTPAIGGTRRQLNNTVTRLEMSSNSNTGTLFRDTRPMSTDRLAKGNFEETFKTFLSKEFNRPLDPRRHLDDLLAFAPDDKGTHLNVEGEDEEIDGKEEKKIIMEMYNKDNRDKHTRQGTIKTALSKNPRVPKASEARVTVEKVRKLPMLRNFKKLNEKSESEKFYASDTREKIQEHKRYLTELKEKVAVYKATDTEPKFELYRRLADFYKEQGLAKKAHIRISGLGPRGRVVKGGA